MKKTALFKFPFLGVVIAGFFLVAFTNSAHAQVTTVGPKDQLYEVPVEDFVSPQLAITILNQEVAELKEELAGLHEGTAAFRIALSRYTYLNAILDGIIDGKTVAQSIAEGLYAVEADRFQITVATLLEYKNEAIELLKA
jgi:hypothetical protein